MSPLPPGGVSEIRKDRHGVGMSLLGIEKPNLKIDFMLSLHMAMSI